MSPFCCARLPFGVNPVQHLSNFSVFPNDNLYFHNLPRVSAK
jgi:hypothetical protein